ncbi:MAG TPA: MBL fold metallo-hydrolase [Desulfomonilaceae bacterium]|nr:MBL fold metallo-hydrolase [Desulfomonilaceae bacterium]
MEILFLGTGAAWCVPEHSCGCAICTAMESTGEERTRTCFVVKGRELILVDCGPDIRVQMRRHALKRPDVVLITHEHGDHYLGLDDLLAFRRSVPVDAWTAIPVYATEQTWSAMELRFGYLLGSLLEKRIAVPGLPLAGTKTRITPFKTFHGPTAPGSVGYVFENIDPGNSPRVVYTSDFMRIDEELDLLNQPDLLIMQSHWFNEPHFNRPFHMSFQNAINWIRKWKPCQTCLVHISDGDLVPGDPWNNALKKLPPESPLKSPASQEPYHVPRNRSEWQAVVETVRRDYEIPGTILVAHDGLRIGHSKDREA